MTLSFSGLQQEFLQGLAKGNERQGEGEDSRSEQVRFHRDRHLFQEGKWKRLFKKKYFISTYN